MKILFTKSQKSFSKLIMNLTEEPVSHTALDFGWFVVHSNLLGVHIEWAKNFKKHSEVVLSLEPVKITGKLREMGKLDKTLQKYEFSPYDYGALFFLGFSLLARKYLKIPLPKSNLWQSSGMLICTEFVGAAIGQVPDPMMTPYKLYLILKASREWQDA